MKKLMYVCVIALLSSPIFAQTVVTTTDVGVPITVDANGNTYVVAKPSYYYYEGHRCYVEKRNDIGVNFLGLRAGFSGGSEIYCYPYP